ncbi:anaerobic ribonucleoside-triphosphate reductase activating protein [Candidatus Gracilibacteria bacterium]|nr:anaerobic ribonucleoside-triphosphate reductase activating protein [Candidatus Gracilibacteria bacterium]
MLIGGINTLTLLDFPGKVSCIIFTAGCNFRCGFCHNPQFVLTENIKKLTGHFIPEEKILSFLDSRKGFLDGIVISGGEPTIQPDLLNFIRKIRAKKILVKLDTNGTLPDVLEKIIKENLIDYFAMDIKASVQNYEKICGINLDTKKIEKSKNLILNSGIPHEFRTTVIKNLHDEQEIEAITKFCEGADLYTIQNFRNQKVLDKKYENFQGFSEEDLEKFKNIAKKYIKKVNILKN